MAAPTTFERERVYTRDGNRCAACGTYQGLTFQHRQAVGMGGSKHRVPLTAALTLCAICNAMCEAEMQRSALAWGWKVRRFVSNAANVPVFYRWKRTWCLLDGSQAIEITEREAMALMRQIYGEQYEKWKEED